MSNRLVTDKTAAAAHCSGLLPILGLVGDRDQVITSEQYSLPLAGDNHFDRQLSR